MPGPDSTPAAPAEDTSARHRLADRRLHADSQIEWNGVKLLVIAGFERKPIAQEIFAEGLRAGSDLAVLVHDVCIVTSVLMQHGNSARSILARLMRSSPENALKAFRDEATGEQRPSLLAAMIAEVVRLEQEFGEEFADFAARVAELRAATTASLADPETAGAAT